MKNHFSSNSLVTLDCTLRDGGYYNSWDFDEKTVSRYLQSIGSAGVDVIEIGFRLPPKGKFLGAFAYSTDHCLRKLPLPKSSLLAVMTNAKDFISYDGGIKQAVKDLFDKAVAVYRGILRKDPVNFTIRQRLEETLALQAYIREMRDESLK